VRVGEASRCYHCPDPHLKYTTFCGIVKPMPPEMVIVQQYMIRSYRVQCALFCSLPDRYRSRRFVHAAAVTLIGETAAGTERSSERWRVWGAVVDGAPWAARPWRDIALDLKSGKLTLETMLEGTEVAASDLRRMIENPAAYESATDELKAILTLPPQTIDEWQRWLEVGLAPATDGGVILMPTGALTEGNTCPLRWTWELWCYANAKSDDGEWRDLSDEELSRLNGRALLHGSRGGMKTMGLAALVFSLCWFIPKYSACHAASTVDQALTCIDYIRRWQEHAHFNHAIEKANQHRVDFTNGSVLFIITASQKGLNHEHTIWFSCDEVELMQYKVLLEGLRIPMARPGRKLPAVLVLASTQKEPGLTMTILIEKAQAGQYRYFRWNVIDVMERCDDWRTRDLPAGISCADYPELLRQANTSAKGEAISALSDRALFYLDALRRNCPLVEYCQGHAKQGCGHYEIDAAIEALQDSVEQFESQMMCLRPSPTGAVYPKFDYRNVSQEAEYRENCRIFGTADYGFATDPAAGNLFCLNGPYYDCFEEYSAYGQQAYEQAEVYAELTKKYGVEFWCVDGSARELITEMRKRGLLVVAVKSHDISRGIEYVSRWICDGTGHRALRIHPRCKNTIRQMQGYMLSDRTNRPKTHQDDHHPDGIRYLAETIGRKRQGQDNTTIRRASPPAVSTGPKYLRQLPPPGQDVKRS